MLCACVFLDTFRVGYEVWNTRHARADVRLRLRRYPHRSSICRGFCSRSKSLSFSVLSFIQLCFCFGHLFRQAWIAAGQRRQEVAKSNRRLLKQLSSSKYEEMANQFGYTFKGIAEFFAKENLTFDTSLMIHPFAQLPWGAKGCALMSADSVGCARAKALQSHNEPVFFKNGVLVAAPKLLSISNEKVG